MAVFNAVVIGSGQAGNPLAHRLADRGRTVALNYPGDRRRRAGADPDGPRVAASLPAPA